MKVITIVGTRPEIIRLSRVISLFDENLEHLVVHTGQNYDYELNEIFFTELEIRMPDYFLNIENTSMGRAIGETIIKTEEILLKEKPEAILILGDTNSSLSAIVAKRLKIPVYHMEAGNRSFDQNVPEEINRKIVDHISDFNLVYTERARQHLLSEGFPPRRIYLTGSPMAEVLKYYKNKISESKILDKLNLHKNEYFVVSMHREENVDNPLILNKILMILQDLLDVYNFPIIFSTHPRTRKRISETGLRIESNKIMLSKPLGFFDYIALQQNAYCTLSDSGTISEESAILNYPAITVRNSMERPEALEAGSIIMTGFDKEIVLNAIKQSQKTAGNQNKSIPYEYKIENVSQRVYNLLLGTCRLSNIWHGIV